MRRKIRVKQREPGRAGRPTKLTPELAQWIRDSDQPLGALAHALDVTESVVWNVKSGRAWRTGIQGSSVFSWRPAA